MKQQAPARFAPLLGALFLLVLVNEPLAEWEHGATVSTLLYPIILAALVLAVGRSGRAGRFAVGLWVVTVALELSDRATSSPTVSVVGRLLDAALVLWCIYILIGEILRRQRAVTFDTLLGGIAVYLMIGFFYSIAFSVVEFGFPGTFLDRGVPLSKLAGETAVSGAAARYPGLVYYSFVTLTTLGYGDIVPGKPLGRSLASSEALVGQLYLTILVAALVGMHLSQRVVNPAESEPQEPGDDPSP
jgi:hypothetical protein